MGFGLNSPQEKKKFYEDFKILSTTVESLNRRIEGVTGGVNNASLMNKIDIISHNMVVFNDKIDSLLKRQNLFEAVCQSIEKKLAYLNNENQKIINSVSQIDVQDKDMYKKLVTTTESTQRIERQVITSQDILNDIVKSLDSKQPAGTSVNKELEAKQTIVIELLRNTISLLNETLICLKGEQGTVITHQNNVKKVTDVMTEPKRI